MKTNLKVLLMLALIISAILFATYLISDGLHTMERQKGVFVISQR